MSRSYRLIQYVHKLLLKLYTSPLQFDTELCYFRSSQNKCPILSHGALREKKEWSFCKMAVEINFFERRKCLVWLKLPNFFGQFIKLLVPHPCIIHISTSITVQNKLMNLAQILHEKNLAQYWIHAPTSSPRSLNCLKRASNKFQHFVLDKYWTSDRLSLIAYWIHAATRSPESLFKRRHTNNFMYILIWYRPYNGLCKRVYSFCINPTKALW
jgi:hypothetical protein